MSAANRRLLLDLSPFGARSPLERDDAADLSLADVLPFGYDGYYNDHTLRTRDGALIQIVRLSGLYAEMLADAGVDWYAHHRNTVLQSIADSNVGIYVWEIRRKTTRWPSGQYANWFASYLNDRLRARFETRSLFQHEVYIGIVRYRHYRGMVGAIDRVLNFMRPDGAVGQLESEVEQVKDLQEKVSTVLSALTDYSPRRLGRQGEYCELARLLRYLATLEDGPVRADAQHLGSALATAEVSFGPQSGLIETESVNQWRVGRMLGMSRWPDGIRAGDLDRFQKLPVEMIVTQAFLPMDKLTAEQATSVSERRLASSRTTATMAAEVAAQRQQQAASRAVLGEHHLSVLVHVQGQVGADEDETRALTLAALEAAVSPVRKAFTDLGVPAVLEKRGAEAAFWSQLPGWPRRNNGRKAKIDALQFACFASLHSFPQGWFAGSLWGECLMVLPTEGNTGYSLNFHEEAPGMVPGHVNVAAKTGYGKTLLIACLVSQADKVNPRVYWFDRGNGATVFVAAMGGVDLHLSLGRPLGNPCQMDDTPENREMLKDLLRMMATCYGYLLGTDDIKRIGEAVDDNYKLPRGDRRLSNLAWRFGDKGSDFYQAMALWHSGGANSAVFDNDADALDLSRDRHYRFEMGELMNEAVARPELPILLAYITHRIEQSLDGTPAIIVWDEAQTLVRHPFWQAKIQGYRETFRRRNAVTIFITPDPRYLYHPVEAVHKQAVTTLYLGNDKADARDYVDNLDCSPGDLEYVQKAAKHEYKVLIKKGLASVRASFDLSDVPEVIPVLSSNDKAVSLMRAVIEELGTHDPSVWVPVFVERALAARTHNL